MRRCEVESAIGPAGEALADEAESTGKEGADTAALSDSGWSVPWLASSEERENEGRGGNGGALRDEEDAVLAGECSDMDRLLTAEVGVDVGRPAEAPAGAVRAAEGVVNAEEDAVVRGGVCLIAAAAP